MHATQERSTHVQTAHLRRTRTDRGRAQKHVYARGSITGKVIGVDPASYTVDVSCARGQIIRGAHVLASAGTRAGGFYLQAISTFLAETGPEGSLDIPANDLKRSVYAVVGFIEENPDQPYVQDFLVPRGGQMRWAEAGLALWRHESDAYVSVENGAPGTYDSASDTTLSNMELVASDGTMVRIGTGTAHHDRTHQDVGAAWSVRGTRNANSPVGSPGPDTPYLQTVYKHPSGTAIVVDAQGNLTWTLAPGARLSLAQTGGGSLGFDGSGNLAVTLPAGKTLGITQTGGAGFAFDTSGNLTFTIPAGKSLAFNQAAGTSFTIDGSGNMAITLAVGASLHVSEPGGTLRAVARQGDVVVGGVAPAGGGAVTGTVIGTPASAIVQTV